MGYLGREKRLKKKPTILVVPTWIVVYIGQRHLDLFSK